MLGMTVAQIERGMSAKEFTEWRAFVAWEEEQTDETRANAARQREAERMAKKARGT